MRAQMQLQSNCWVATGDEPVRRLLTTGAGVCVLVSAVLRWVESPRRPGCVLLVDAALRSLKQQKDGSSQSPGESIALQVPRPMPAGYGQERNFVNFDEGLLQDFGTFNFMRSCDPVFSDVHTHYLHTESSDQARSSTLFDLLDRYAILLIFNL